MRVSFFGQNFEQVDGMNGDTLFVVPAKICAVAVFPDGAKPYANIYLDGGQVVQTPLATELLALVPVHEMIITVASVANEPDA